MNQLPTTLIIFGATGDLTARKLMPSLYNLFLKDLLPQNFHIIGFSRRDLDEDTFRKMMDKAIRKHYTGRIQTKVLNLFLQSVSYHQALFEPSDGYLSLAERLGYKDGVWTACTHRMFYLATPPSHYPDIINNLSSSGLADPCSDEEGINQILIEKPFGSNLKTAEELDMILGKKFQEEQIYRIDHYLGKEPLQNIITFRFSNNIFEPSWNKDYIESVHIRMHESIDIQGRGAFYDSIGALRDVGQNHLLQMLAAVAMENPGAYDAVSIRSQRARVLETLINIDPQDIPKQTYRAQYQGYTESDGVDSKSQTETYFRIECYLDNDCWEGVPFILEAGKALDQKRTEIVITFKHPQKCICPPGQGHDYRNQLIFRIQPDEGISIKFWAKHPGLNFRLDDQNLEFNYKSFNQQDLPDAYEKILLDALNQDQTLFTQTDELLATWDFITGIVEAWDQDLAPLRTHKSGTLPQSNE